MSFDLLSTLLFIFLPDEFYETCSVVLFFPLFVWPFQLISGAIPFYVLSRLFWATYNVPYLVCPWGFLIFKLI